MDDPRSKLRLQEARSLAGFKTPTEAARAFPHLINQNTIISHENGNRPISKKAAAKYAQAFKVSPGWILFEEEEDKFAATEVPVVSMVTAGALQFREGVESKDVIRTVSLSGLPDGDWIGLIVDGDSMNRIAPPGSIIVVNRRDKSLLNEKFYVFVNDMNESTFKMFRKNPRGLRPYSTNPDYMAMPLTDDMQVFGRARIVVTEI
jgi:SOS-response transcriptional repressor LexA